MSRRLGSARRPSDTRNTRNHIYLSRHLRHLPLTPETLDPAYTKRIDILRRVFLVELPPPAADAVTEIRNLHIEGTALIRRLEALRERYNLDPPQPADPPMPAAARITRIVCSDGLH